MTAMTPPLGGSLDSLPPAFSAVEVSAIARRHWGLEGDLSPLTSERDQNHHLRGPAGQFVIKIANLAEGHAVQRMQNRALRHIESRDPALPVPRVIATLAGADDVVLPDGHLVRVLSWLDGVPLHMAAQSPAQSAALAQMLARLTMALAGFDDPAAGHVLQWDIKNAAQLSVLLDDIADKTARRLCSDVLARFDGNVAPRLGELRWQVVHSDLNPHNVLVDPANPERVAGILDFGDMVRTPLVCDLAVAAAYRIDRDDPIGSLVGFAAAYHAVNPLTALERAVYFDLVAARMVTTISIASWRAARYAENAPYILRNFPSARAGLQALAALDPAEVAEALRRACPVKE